MIKNGLMMAVGLLLSLALTVAPVTREQARQQAAQFLKNRHGEQAARGMRLTAEDTTADAASYYVFNVGQEQGFVLISGDDRTEPVLGYADEGSFCQEQMPANLRAWLAGYERQMAWLDARHAASGVESSASRGAMRKAGVRLSISPLIATRWDQTTPYNLLCPLDSNDVRTVTGCVATAMSQLLYYYRQPEATTKAIPGYTLAKKKITVDAMPVTPLKWELMQESHGAGTTGEQDSAVATLMALVGAAFEMDYNTESRGGSQAVPENAPTVLADYFGYDADAKVVYRDNYAYSDWIDLIYRQLKNGNPVFYNGQSTGGGHSFLCDGYDEDDLFHINWGWGGRSNGYYRLSVLLPEDQGAGGSSNLTAFSYDQSVMINVKPQDDGIDETGRTRLTANTINGGGVGSYTRASVEDDFANVWIQTLFYNMTGSEQTFDVGLGLYDEEEQLQKVLWSYEGLPISYRGGYSYRTYPFFGAGIADGTYRIVNISRLNGETEWMPSYDTEKHYLTATIEGTTLTLDSLNVSPNTDSKLSAVLRLEGDAVKGQDTRVVAVVTNNSTNLYTGSLKLIRVTSSGNYLLAGTQTDIEAGATVEVPFTFKPTSNERYSIVLWDKGTKNVATEALTVDVGAGQSAQTGTLALVETTLSNGDLDEGVVFGTSAKATVTLRNDGDTNHTSGVFIWLFRWILDGDWWRGSSVTSKTVDVTIPAGETKDVEFEFKGLEVGSVYSFRYNYTDDYYGNGIGSTGRFTSMNGVTTYLADGTSTVTKAMPDVAVPNEVAAIDLSGLEIATVEPNANPNTLYIFSPDDEIPASLSDRNVVRGSEVSKLALVDGYDFYSPVAFTAADATYTRQFAVGADGTNGWSTIVVPFDVSEVRSGAKVIDWFHSADDAGKHFWLKEFSSEADRVVYFDYADELKAYMPYIIAVPGDRWGDSWNLTGRDITFVGHDVKVSADAKAVVNSTNMKFIGSTRGIDVENDYLLNVQGNAFEKATGQLEPFRACFRSVGYATSGVLPIVQEGTEVTALPGIQTGKEAPAAVFSLQGIRVQGSSASLPKGIYVVGGKKIIR